MLHSKRSLWVALLIALPLFAAIVIVSQEHSRQAALAQTKAVPPVTPIPSARPAFDNFPVTYSAGQKAILKQARTKPKTLPASIIVAGATLAAANSVYTLAAPFDVNGFAYYQSRDGTQFCQWSTLNLCWSIRSSLVEDSPDVRPSAEYCSHESNTYAKGPAGQFWFGGMCLMVNLSRAPVVKALSKS